MVRGELDAGEEAAHGRQFRRKVNSGSEMNIVLCSS
jgi:hypothetical protein